MSNTVMWVMTLDKDYQPHPWAAWTVVGETGVQSMLRSLRMLVDLRMKHKGITAKWSSSVRVCVDHGIDLGSVGYDIDANSERLLISIERRVPIVE